MNLKQYIETHGTRAAAIEIVNKRILKIIGLSVHDLPETAALVEIYDSIEDILINGDEEYGKQQIAEILYEITPDFIEEICW
jgi:hypothetical protein